MYLDKHLEHLLWAIPTVCLAPCLKDGYLISITVTVWWFWKLKKLNDKYENNPNVQENRHQAAEDAQFNQEIDQYGMQEALNRRKKRMAAYEFSKMSPEDQLATIKVNEKYQKLRALNEERERRKLEIIEYCKMNNLSAIDEIHMIDGLDEEIKAKQKAIKEEYKAYCYFN